VIEAASWRLASELMRRHPNGARLFRGHPGSGQYDVLWIVGVPNPGVDVRLNRTGTIQVHGRADGGREIQWQPTSWIEYLGSDSRAFIQRLEAAAGWPGPAEVPPSTPETLTYRVLAALAAMGTKTVHPIGIAQGYIDTSGYGGGPNTALRDFSIPSHLTDVRSEDFYGEPGYRFWLPCRDGAPFAAIEQTSATAWFLNRSAHLDLRMAYRELHKEPALVAAEVLRTALAG